MAMTQQKLLVMLNSAGRGGMRSVVEAYERDGLIARWNVRVIHSHVEGSLPRRVGTAAVALLQFGSLLLRRRVGLLHCHVAMSGSFWRKAVFSELARLFRVPVLLHLHGSELEIFYDAQGALGRWWIRRQLERADRVLVLSESWRDFVNRVAPHAKSAVILNYVRLPPAQECGEPHLGVNILFLGILGRRKGIYDLLPVFKRVLPNVLEMHLWIGGNGEIAETTDAIAALGLSDSADLLGWIAGDDKNALLATADVFILPSYNEGLPISLLEAMSYGVPVISTRVGGIPELVRDGIDGYLIEPGDQAGLAQALARLATDGDLRRRMGHAARERVMAKFSDAAVLPLLEAIYADVCCVSTHATVPLSQRGGQA
jgi:glycosyltransferase involved in cell wall biosynthesis